MFNRFKQDIARAQSYLRSLLVTNTTLSFPTRCANLGIDASKLPSMFIDEISMEIMDQIVMLDRTIGHAVDPKHTNIAGFKGINPFTNEPLNLAPTNLEMNFHEHEIFQIIEILNDTQNDSAAKLSAAIADGKLNAFEQCSIDNLVLLEKCCNNFPDLLNKIDLYIKKKLENQLYEQREIFITHLENINKLIQLRETAKLIHPMNEEQRFNLFLLNLELIGEYAGFIESTKIAINTSNASDHDNDKLSEIKRVLSEAYSTYNKEVTAFIKWANSEEMRLACYEKIYLEDRLKGAVIPFYDYNNLVKEKVANYERRMALKKIHLSSFQCLTHFKPSKPKQNNDAKPENSNLRKVNP